MLKGVKQLWPGQRDSQSSGTPTLSPASSYSNLDQATPRAQVANPFDQKMADGSVTPGIRGMSLDSRPQSPGHGGLKTPTSHGFMPLPLGTPGAGQPTTGLTVGGSVGQNQGIGFGLHEPPKMRKALKLDEEKVESGASTPHARGTLAVKLISARGLAVSHASQPEPYVVMQFEQNEFISRSPHPASSQSVPFTTAQAQPMVPASPNLTRSASGLGVGTISRAFAEAMGRKKKEDETPKDEPTSWLGKPGPGDPVWKEEVNFDLTSSTSALHVSVYDRSREGEGFLGMLDLKPVLKDGYTLDGWYKLGTRGHETVTGELWLQLTYTAIRSKVHLKPSDFDFLKLIGRGTFGRVFQVRKKDTRRIYAMKVLSKKEIVAKKEVAHTIGERKILQRSLECPFLVGLKFSFQTEKELYFVTDYKCGGELFWHLQKEGRFSEDRARFYIAELILALEHLHKYNIVYRDLKPENILLDATGHVALCDFGLSKPDLSNDQLTNTFCGTTEYLAPEVLLDEKGYGKHVDFWSLGVLLFEMCCGWSPFYAEQTQEMYRLICYGKIRFPKHVIGDDGKQFVKGLLNRNPQNRLGARNGAQELKEHPFFSNIDWELLYRKQITPPFKPIVDSDESVANFDPEFTNASLQEAGAPITDDDAGLGTSVNGKHMYLGPGGSLRDTGGGMAIQRPDGLKKSHDKGLSGVAGSVLSNSVQENFRGFTYTGESVLPQSMLAHREEVTDHEHAVDESEEDEEEEEDFEEDEGMRTRRQSDVEME